MCKTAMFPDLGLLPGPPSLRDRFPGMSAYILPSALAVGLVVLLPVCHLTLVYYNRPVNKSPVDRDNCNCGCWDTIFKESYEDRPGTYHHVYFNVNLNVLCMWTLTVVFCVLLYETFRYLVTLAIRGQARRSMTCLFISSLYSHYYTWWSYFNAWNDDFYSQWYHQAFFGITEILSTLVVIFLCDRRRETNPRLLLAIVTVAILHILAASKDQFVENVILNNGARFQVFRDIAFMLPDVLHLVLPSIECLWYARRRHQRICDVLNRRHMVVSAVALMLLWCVYTVIQLQESKVQSIKHAYRHDAALQ